MKVIEVYKLCSGRDRIMVMQSRTERDVDEVIREMRRMYPAGQYDIVVKTTSGSMPSATMNENDKPYKGRIINK